MARETKSFTRITIVVYAAALLVWAYNRPAPQQAQAEEPQPTLVSPQTPAPTSQGETALRNIITPPAAQK